MCASAFAFTTMAAFVKRLAPVLPQFELVFFRSWINLVLVLGLMLARGERLWPARDKPLLVFRGLVGFAGVACMFYSLAHLAMPVATMLNWCSPLFVILFSKALLGERMPSLSGLFIPVAFLGMFLLLDPLGTRVSVPLAGAVAGLGAAVFGGMAYVAVRAATARAGVNVIVLFFVAVSTLASAPLAALDFRGPTPAQWLELLALGSFATVGQLTMTRAYRYAPAGVVSMMNLLNPVFGAGFGLILFGENLAGLQWAGMAMVAVAIAGLTARRTAG